MGTRQPTRRPHRHGPRRPHQNPPHRARWSQAELGERVSTDSQRISRYENGRITPSLDALIRLAEALDVSCDYLLIDGAPRRPLSTADAAIAERVSQLATLDTADRDAILHILDGLIAKTASATPSTKPADMAADPAVPHRQIRAAHTATTITVYQAYSSAIAEPALAAGRFVAPFKRERMTWIKPSLLWMAYRSGWATKPGQERVLAIEITRDGFEWALAHASLSHYEPGTYPDHDTWAAAKATSPVRIQWDPERDLTHAPLDHRAIQIGLSGVAVDRYVDVWTVAITDTTDLMRRIHALVDAGDHDSARALLPDEPAYPLPADLAAAIGAR